MRLTKEQKAKNAADELRRAALPIHPDVAPPESDGVLSVGWHFNTHNLRLEKGCSSNVYHSDYKTDETTTQGTRWFYSTKRLALLAMRAAVELEHAERIERINRMIIDDYELNQKETK